MPYAIHEMRRHPRNVGVFFSREEKEKKKIKKRKLKRSFQMTTKAATAIAQSIARLERKERIQQNHCFPMREKKRIYIYIQVLF
jgi:hypothetical protein